MLAGVAGGSLPRSAHIHRHVHLQEAGGDVSSEGDFIGHPTLWKRSRVSPRQGPSRPAMAPLTFILLLNRAPTSSKQPFSRCFFFSQASVVLIVAWSM